MISSRGEWDYTPGNLDFLELSEQREVGLFFVFRYSFSEVSLFFVIRFSIFIFRS